MTVRTYAATALLAGGAWLALGASPAFAVCDAYSGGCPTTPPGDIGGGTDSPATGGETETPGGTDNPATGGDSEVGGGGQNPATGGDSEAGGAQNPAAGGTTTGGTSGGTATTPSTLPFTGGELVLMTAIGAGALAGGTALVVAGRRRGQALA